MRKPPVQAFDVERPVHNCGMPLLYCPDHVTPTPRSYFDSLSTSGPTARGYAKVSSRDRVMELVACR